jgi:hypothetical protein
MVSIDRRVFVGVPWARVASIIVRICLSDLPSTPVRRVDHSSPHFATRGVIVMRTVGFEEAIVQALVSDARNRSNGAVDSASPASGSPGGMV